MCSIDGNIYGKTPFIGEKTLVQQQFDPVKPGLSPIINANTIKQQSENLPVIPQLNHE